LPDVGPDTGTPDTGTPDADTPDVGTNSGGGDGGDLDAGAEPDGSEGSINGGGGSCGCQIPTRSAASPPLALLLGLLVAAVAVRRK
jgi:MYXO-CTERM domain-containing protein